MPVRRQRRIGRGKNAGRHRHLACHTGDGLWFRFRGHNQQDNDSAADIGFIPGTACDGGAGTNAAGDPVPIHLASPYLCDNIPSLGQTGNGVLNQNTQVPQPFLNSLAIIFSAHDPLLSKVPSLDHSGLRRDVQQ